MAAAASGSSPSLPKKYELDVVVNGRRFKLDVAQEGFMQSAGGAGGHKVVASGEISADKKGRVAERLAAFFQEHNAGFETATAKQDTGIKKQSDAKWLSTAKHKQDANKVIEDILAILEGPDAAAATMTADGASHPAELHAKAVAPSAAPAGGAPIINVHQEQHQSQGDLAEIQRQLAEIRAELAAARARRGSESGSSAAEITALKAQIAALEAVLSRLQRPIDDSPAGPPPPPPLPSSSSAAAARAEAFESPEPVRASPPAATASLEESLRSLREQCTRILARRATAPNADAQAFINALSGESGDRDCNTLIQWLKSRDKPVPQATITTVLDREKWTKQATLKVRQKTVALLHALSTTTKSIPEDLRAWMVQAQLALPAILKDLAAK